MDGSHFPRRRPYSAAGDAIHAKAAELQGMVEAWLLTFDLDSDERDVGLMAAGELLSWRGKWLANQRRLSRRAA